MRTFLGLMLLCSIHRSLRASTWDGLGAGAMQTLAACQDAYNQLEFRDAESLAASVIARYPAHPLPRIFMQGALLSQLQENIASKTEDAGLRGRFDNITEETLSLAIARDSIQPDAYSKFYLGGCLGARGLVKLYRGSYVAAYKDGQLAEKALQASLALDPGLEDVKLGLGQYLYYTGSMAGLLRVVLNLPGSTSRGIALLEDAASRGSFTAIPARLSLARIFCYESINYAKALPYVEEALHCYPGNYAYLQYAVDEAKGLGPGNPRGQALRATVLKLWHSGWRPPAYVHMDLKSLGLQSDTALAVSPRAEP